MKKTQRAKVIELLLAQGFVTRNWCLANYISRLSALIQDLEAEGWEFTTSREGRDYRYTLKAVPQKTVSRVVEKGGRFFEERVQVPMF